MNKREFLAELAEKIDCLPSEDIGRWLDYYSEMIDDRVEDGMTEEQAVYAMGNIYDVATQILIDTPMRTLVKTRAESARRLKTWEIILIICGAVIWVPMLFAAVVTVLSMYVVLWALLISFFAVAVSFIVAGVIGIYVGATHLLTGNMSEGLSALGTGLLLGGLGLVMFVCLRYVTKWVILASRFIWRGIKKLIIRREKSV